MDSAFVDRAWDKWVTGNVGSSGKFSDYVLLRKSSCLIVFFFFLKSYTGSRPLKAAVLINYDPAAPSRLLSTM